MLQAVSLSSLFSHEEDYLKVGLLVRQLYLLELDLARQGIPRQTSIWLVFLCLLGRLRRRSRVRILVIAAR